VSAAAILQTRLPHLGSSRLRAAVLVMATVLIVHSCALSWIDRAPGRGWSAQPSRAVSVRNVALAAQAEQGQVNKPEQAQATARPSEMEPRPAEKARGMAASTAQAEPESPDVQQAAAAAGASKAQEAPAPTPDPGGLEVPVYATQLPNAALLRYESRRGLSGGLAELAWRRSADGYQLSLQGQALGAPLSSWASVGGLDAAGLAPLRYTESRKGRELRAVNFQRDTGRVTFSGPQTEYPLLPGMQDRLSWMLQLPAILQANPALAQPGAQVQLAVVGARGDAEVWTFAVQARVALDLPAGVVVDAVHLLREPRRPYDTQVQVWLDPARQHLPVQAWLRIRATGEGTELRLLESVSP
jgi:hypothetical protein